MCSMNILDKEDIMKIATILIAGALLLSGCKSSEEKQQASKISPQKLCSAFDLKTAENLVHKKLKIDTLEKHKFPTATTCSIKNNVGYPYFTITLFYNKENNDAKYFAPPKSLFNFSYKNVGNTLVAIAPKSKEVAEVFQKGKNNWVLSILLANVKVYENSAQEKQLIKLLSTAMDKLQSTK